MVRFVFKDLNLLNSGESESFGDERAANQQEPQPPAIHSDAVKALSGCSAEEEKQEGRQKGSPQLGDIMKSQPPSGVRGTVRSPAVRHSPMKSSR